MYERECECESERRGKGRWLVSHLFLPRVLFGITQGAKPLWRTVPTVLLIYPAAVFISSQLLTASEIKLS